MGIENLDKIFKPKSITVVGASNRIGSAGYRIFRNLIGSQFDGVVYPINPNYESIQGVESYKTVNDLQKIPDLAVIVTPSKVVIDVVEQCGKKGIKGILIISAGFKEIGEEGKKLEKKLNYIRKKYDLRIVGPNCVGIIMPYLGMNATFAGAMPDKGNIALFSQSGAVCGSILDWAASAKVGFSSFVSVGSMLDVDFGDLIDYFGRDLHTRSIVLYAENITHARKFMSAARSFARVKPIIVIKSGRYKEGAKAASSHTGAMAGEDYIYDAAFKRAGCVRVKKISELFNCSSILAKQPRPTGANLAIITNAGGPGVLAVDAIVENGGKLAVLSEETITELNKFLPRYWSKGNPMDIIGDSDEEAYRKTIEVALTDKNIDGIIVITVPQVMANPKKLAENIIDISKKSTKPILTAFVGEESVHYARQLLNRNEVPTYPTPEEAVESYMHLYHYARNLELLFETPEERNVENTKESKEKIKMIIQNALKENRKILHENEAKEILELYNIKSTRPWLVAMADEAINQAKKIGYPVVMKIHSPQITHKSDSGGVALNLDCDDAIKSAYKTMMKTVKKNAPDAIIEGVTIQKMVKNVGAEFILGSKKDPVFGSIILFGLGGIFTELYKDRAIGFPPLNQVLAQRILEKTKAFQLLKGYRNIPPANMNVVEETMINFSQLIEDHPEISELDINPLIPQGDDLIAVDARIVIDTHPENNPHMIISKYPSHYIKKVTLRDGTEVILRPIKPEDEPLWQKMFDSFSEETVRYRFFRVIKETPHKMRTRYCNIDYDREIGIVAEIKKDGDRRFLGVTRIIADPGSNQEAEFALVVSDKWQRHGLGAEFIDYTIEIARDKSFKKIYGPVLKDNIPMIKLCREKNFEFSEGDPGEYIVSYTL
ncbi:MAG: bifunctional acetate--CoA ligase family protein/GNAT family N-acetyltransferase [Candidatus Thermoplasmatota archaeon]|nr:bifunctional acetate--CoA ligase family protein/GNAT family N-acetyltransferase [Candidatus Thermoplasmatota archaeon]